MDCVSFIKSKFFKFYVKTHGEIEDRDITEIRQYKFDNALAEEIATKSLKIIKKKNNNEK